MAAADDPAGHLGDDLRIRGVASMTLSEWRTRMKTRALAAAALGSLLAHAGCGSPGSPGGAPSKNPARADAGGGAPDAAEEAMSDGHGGDGRVPSVSLGTISVDGSGAYRITFRHPAWTFAGKLGVPAKSIHEDTGSDRVGSYREVTFAFTDSSAKTAGIRLYDAIPAAVLTETFVAGATNDSAPFPTFSTYPHVAHHVSYSDTEFAPVSFDTLTADSPFVFFDDDANTFILSAASDFMNAATAESAAGALSTGIDPAIQSFPAGFSHQSLLVAEPGIRAAYGAWGGVLTSRSGKKRVANDAKPYLERLGYWTDNGAYYYYQYDTSVGYPATLTGVSEYFTSLGVPLAYMQLDSWWYPKGPEQSWTDKADGQYTYTADPTVLPDGLASFQEALGLPLVTHARWIDPSSPYRAQYTMSNNVSIDPRYWASVASYISGAGVSVYEQDWLNQNALPDTANLGDQEAFMDDMASAMASVGIDLQYCMPLPRHYLQGSKYANLTTTRVSVDRFSSPRYQDFFYVSLLTSSLGAWPWSDTFNSTEVDNLLLSTLSAGMVGVGDETGTASAANLLQAVRPDGVIVKPDSPIVPLDSTFIAQASGVDAPLVASTYTDFGGMRASYVYAFSTGTSSTVSFAPSELGYAGKVLVFDYFQQAPTLLDASATFTGGLVQGSAYYVVVPLGPSGIAFAGDPGKFVSLGRKRIASVSDDGTLRVSVAFASGEKTVTLHGYATSSPTATASTGSVGAVAWDAGTKLFTVPVSPDAGTASLSMR
jgi:hypothetical protein